MATARDVAGEPYETTWKTDNAGTSTSTQITLPLVINGNYNFIVDWGDDNTDHITVYDQAETTHTYSSSGTYTVKITGTIDGWSFNNGGDKLKLLTVDVWGILILGDTSGHFYGCSNLTSTAIDSPKVGPSMAATFRDCSALNGGLANWDVSGVTAMNSAFWGATAFNDDISGWDVSNVTNMIIMFKSATAFNQDISGWAVSGLTSMLAVFRDAAAFNQDLSGWDMSGVTNMEETFWGATAFNGDISSWDVSDVDTMIIMFRGATAFNQDISGWAVSGLTNMLAVFRDAAAFNQDLSGWNMTGVTNMTEAFYGCTAFNQDLSGWDVSSVASMLVMFTDASAFSRANYDLLLVGWEAQAVQNNVNFVGSVNGYTSGGAAAAAHAALLADHSWTITDGGPI